MAGVVLLSRSIRPWESMHGNARTFSEQVTASIKYDSSCVMSDVVFRAAPPIGGYSCICLSSYESNSLKDQLTPTFNLFTSPNALRATITLSVYQF